MPKNQKSKLCQSGWRSCFGGGFRLRTLLNFARPRPMMIVSLGRLSEFKLDFPKKPTTCLTRPGPFTICKWYRQRFGNRPEPGIFRRASLTIVACMRVGVPVVLLLQLPSIRFSLFLKLDGIE
ncbi:hypothetical protein WN944_001088 [Citrus x changshan-huyou]|uniref:Uncharacterized protein n=1 Tax=Citrus x changshan-huyou TaxID=2935761 RepID=A0AAP0MGN0_9ROSI